MNRQTFFVPKVLLCGDETEFISRVGGQRPFKIVGHVKFRGEANGEDFDFLKDRRVSIDDKLCDTAEFFKVIKEGAIIVFNDYNLISAFVNTLMKLRFPRGQLMTTLEFINLPPDNFYDLYADMHLITHLKNLSIKTLLDVDAHFVKGQLFTKEPNELTEIDCIYDGDFFPLKQNIFHHVYKNFSECHLMHYDAALISEKSPADFDTAFYILKDTTDLVITFASNGSELLKHIQDTKDNFKKVDFCFTLSGSWIFCYRYTLPTDFAMYVITHKALPPEHVQTFPDKYKLIHAGRAIGQDLGYLGDNTGDNISELNLYINEVTAFYWIWKNTSHTAIGLSHYRRFFYKDKKENFLTEEEALTLLGDYDIVVSKPIHISMPWHELLKRCVPHGKIVEFAEEIVRKNLMRTHPDYLKAFDYRLKFSGGYFKDMFVTRRNVFNAYCEWIFSFMLDSTREVLKETQLSKITGYSKRLMAFLCEGMLTVWLMNNNLRVKEMDIFQVPGL